MRDIAIVGAGIVGLAHAYAFARRGDRVRVYERSQRAQGASVRNFGMIWPIGQPAGERANLALRSRDIWRTILDAARLPYFSAGSLHLAYHPDEQCVAQEFAAAEPHRARWLTRGEAMAKSPAVNPHSLRGGLFSEQELVVDPRLVIRLLPEYLDEVYGVSFNYGVAVADPHNLTADLVIVANGSDFETLYPALFEASNLTRCKLQMMRTVPQPSEWSLGPALAAGLTMRFYSSFKSCPSLGSLERRVADTLPEYDRWGIHVMTSQMPDGSLVLGDSHEYGLEVDLFNKEEIDRLILGYLATFAAFPNPQIAQRWYGVYAKHFDKPYIVLDPEPGVKIVNGLGGAGMTLSFGLAEQVAEEA